jgi:hypothetical protein
MGDGVYANHTGNQLERTVRDLFSAAGFTLMRFRDYENARAGLLGAMIEEDLLLSDVPYTSIYGHSGKTEFLALSKRLGLNMRIECKWQQSSGSVDEKLPYLYLNCLEAMPEDQILIIIDGEGFKPGAKNWLREAVVQRRYRNPGNEHKLIRVQNLVEFITWANQTLRI